jgi:hypothetical protein
MKKIHILLFNLLFLIGCAKAPSEISNKDYYWVQYSDNNNYLFRVILDKQDSCPTIKIDGLDTKTQERKHKYESDFPIKICQADFQNDKEHKVEYKKLNLKTKSNGVSKISLIGDTGCRTTGGKFEQNCNKIEEYPFSEIAKNIANNSSDAIIHIGDYYYSDKKCIDSEKCGGRPFGDNFATWEADFLENGKQFFYKSPIVFIRGNHELCNRGGKGWFTILDQTLNFRECTTFTKGYSVKINNINFFALDSSAASDASYQFSKLNPDGQKETMEFYQGEMKELSNSIDSSKQNIVLSHKPFYVTEGLPWIGSINESNIVIDKTLDPKSLSIINFILSGHIHTGSIMEFENKPEQDQKYHFYQVISGNSGSSLYKSGITTPGMTNILGKEIKSFFQYHDFGYSEITINEDKITDIDFFVYDGTRKKNIKFD